MIDRTTRNRWRTLFGLGLVLQALAGTAQAQVVGLLAPAIVTNNVCPPLLQPKPAPP